MVGRAIFKAMRLSEKVRVRQVEGARGVLPPRMEGDE